MEFFKRRKKPDKAGTNPFSGIIAGRIVRLQMAISQKANRQINRYNPRTQYLALVLFFTVSATMLGLSLTCNRQRVLLPGGKNDIPVHVGAPSAHPAPKYATPKTDSLTSNK
jgi:hypothetical protein